MKEALDNLVKNAVALGATEAAFIPPAELIVDDTIPEYCREPGCPNFGLSASCPPHVEGVEGFRRWKDLAISALVIRIDVPTSVLLSEDRSEIMRLLHEIVAGVERQAVALNYTNSKGFAGGSCKNLFCSEHVECCRVAGKRCRNPELARPSMSGFGINVGKMMESAGWNHSLLDSKNHFAEPMSWVAGLVLIW